MHGHLDNAWYHNIEFPENSHGLSREGKVAQHTHRLLCAAQGYTRQLIGNSEGAQVKGWKQIWYTAAELRFLQQLFPCAKFVLNLRFDFETWHESIQTLDFNRTMSELKNKNEELLDWAHAQEDGTVFELHLDQFNVERFNQLLVWLNVTGCSYTNVLHANNKNAKDADSNMDRGYSSVRYLDEHDDVLKCTK